MKHFDVIVIGGGHAGTEAAAASARRGARTALVSINLAVIGSMSCNPAIGGVGKGHLVREVDALDGLIARAADLAGIQFRLLNRRKGPAVQGPRLQADRALYRTAIQRALARQANLSLLDSEVVALKIQRGTIAGVELADGSVLGASAVVLTAGTFLNGRIHVGDKSWPAGRMGENASERLACQIRDGGRPVARLKTGTPPRLDANSIDWSGLESQAGDEDPTFLSYQSIKVAARQISCGITHTNERTHDIVRENLAKSAMYGGFIEGVGPRYCPSLEDKVVRFAEKSSHQIFLEPESLSNTVVYPNGISTSLPADVQVAYVQSIKGLEKAMILQPGYAIEYDYFDPRGLTKDLQTKDTAGLFFAGQINGTTGYEEAAAQGLIAGANAAAFALDSEPIVLSRTNSYIGVMIDDLTSFGVTEPYRMFTSRAEFRLSVRADNADQRLTELGRSLHLVGDDRWSAFSQKRDRVTETINVLRAQRVSTRDYDLLGLRAPADGAARSLFDLAAVAEIDAGRVSQLSEAFAQSDRHVQAQVVIEAKYAQYLGRENADAEKLRQEEGIILSPTLDISKLPGLSSEIQRKLLKFRPSTLADAKKIEGMTPSALLILLAAAKRGSRQKLAG